MREVDPSVRLTITYEEGEDGWIIASVPEVAGVHSQGKTREEARANVLDALNEVLQVRFGEHPSVDPAQAEFVELRISA